MASGMEFAKRLMGKYGWTEGKGLGREEAGVAEALKPKLKFDNAGLGHDAGEEFTFQWWDHVFNQAASNISVVKDQEGTVRVSGMGQLKVNKTRPSSGDPGTKYHGGFIKGGTLVGLEEEIREERREVKDHSLKLTDDQLFNICGGLTAHKGARHGLTMSAKLARIKEQEQKLMEAWSKGDQAKKKKKKRMKMEQEEETNGDSARGNTGDLVTEIIVGDEFPKAEKKKKRKKEQEREESEKQSLVQAQEEVASQEEIPKQKKKKRKKREREKDEENLEKRCERMVVSEVHKLEKKKKKKRLEQEDQNVHESQADAKDSDKMEGKSTLEQNNIECLPVEGKKKKKSKKRDGGGNDVRSSENSDDDGIEQKNPKYQSLSSGSAASSNCKGNAKKKKKKKGEEFQDENCALNVEENFDMKKKKRDHSDMQENCGELADMKITKEKKRKIEDEGIKSPSRESERDIQPKKKRKKKIFRIRIQSDLFLHQE